MGRRKEEQEKTGNTPTNRTINQWSESSKTKNGISTTKQTVWTQVVHNRIRQKTGEIQTYRAYEKGEEKWLKECMSRKGKGGISEEGQEIMEDRDIWTNETTLRGVIQESRKREREGRELFGKWMKLTSVRSQDQRRMLQVNSHTFPSNARIHKITKKKESDRCYLCKDLWIVEGRFKKEKDLPEQTLGHIQHTCEALSATHIDTHHQWW
jgi:hypothetical protein